MLRAMARRYITSTTSARHFASGHEPTSPPAFLEVVKLGSIWTHPKVSCKIGYTDIMAETRDDVISANDPNLLLQYWPSCFKFVVPYFSTFRDQVKQFLSDGHHWTKDDIERHEDLISHESTLVGRQPDKERRMYTLVYLETVYVLDDICEECVLSGDERLVEMAFDLIDACQAILSGRETEAKFDSKYQDSYPELLEKTEYSLGLSRRLHHGLATNMGTPLLKAVKSAGYRTFDKLKEEYKFWLWALERNEHASVDRFINIKSASSFFAVLNMADYWDEDLHHVNFDHPVQLLSTFVNQASNDLFSYPKEDNAGLNPFNMIQQSIMSDKMSVKDALVSNIHRRNGYMRALELSYMVLEGPAKMAAQAPLRTMAGWERYFSHTRRYGWTNIGENTMQPNPMK